MNLEYGLTFDRTFAGKTDRSKLIAKAVSRIGSRIGKRIRSRLICDPPSSGFEFDQLVPTVRALNRAGHDVTISICDSLAMPEFTDPNTGKGPDWYRERAVLAVKNYSPGSDSTDYEIVNEWGGDWLGDEERVAECAENAREIVSRAGHRTIAGLFFSFYDQGERMFETVKRYPIKADRFLISIYPWEIDELYRDGSKIATYTDWRKVFARLHALVPWAELGFSEFGPQPRRSSLEERANLIRHVHAIRPPEGDESPASKKFIGLWHYWQGYQELVGRPGMRGLEPVFLESWP